MHREFSHIPRVVVLTGPEVKSWVTYVWDWDKTKWGPFWDETETFKKWSKSDHKYYTIWNHVLWLHFAFWPKLRIRMHSAPQGPWSCPWNPQLKQKIIVFSWSKMTDLAFPWGTENISLVVLTLSISTHEDISAIRRCAVESCFSWISICMQYLYGSVIEWGHEAGA